MSLGTVSLDVDGLSKLRIKVEGTAMEAGIDFVLAQNHEARVKAVRRVVDFACNHLVEHRDKKQLDNEDGLTVQICGMLSTCGVEATHNTSVGGNCDIVVREKDNFLWLAEAKKHSSYDWLDKGFQQLSTRYSTGNAGQDNGDVLIYCFTTDAKSVLDEWQKRLKRKNPDVETSVSASGDPLCFDSVHKHVGSGLNFHVRHKIVSLFWDPKDK